MPSARQGDHKAEDNPLQQAHDRKSGRRVGSESGSDAGDKEPEVGPVVPPGWCGAQRLGGEEEKEEAEDDSYIGPSLPPDFERSNEALHTPREGGLGQDSEGIAGPIIFPHLLSKSEGGPAEKHVDQDEDDENAYAPALPPDLIEARRCAGSGDSSGKRRPVTGPAMLKEGEELDNDDDEYGPAMPTGEVADDSAIDETIRCIESRARDSKNSLDPEASSKQTGEQSRSEWMLVPPKNAALADLLKAPAAMMKSRGFSKTQLKDDDGSSEWTETPEERAARIRTGKDNKRKRPEKEETVSAEVLERENQIRRKIIEHNNQYRPKSLMETHVETVMKDRRHAENDGSRRTWDRDRDINAPRVSSASLRGRLTDAGSLSSRFSASRGGSYM